MRVIDIRIAEGFEVSSRYEGPLRDFEKPGPLPFCGTCKSCGGTYRCMDGKEPREPSKEKKQGTPTYKFKYGGHRWTSMFPCAYKEHKAENGKIIKRGERYEYRIRRTTENGKPLFFKEKYRLEDSAAWLIYKDQVEGGA